MLPSWHMPMHMSMHISMHMSMHISMHMSVHISIHMSIVVHRHMFGYSDDDHLLSMARTGQRGARLQIQSMASDFQSVLRHTMTSAVELIDELAVDDLQQQPDAADDQRPDTPAAPSVDVPSLESDGAVCNVDDQIAKGSRSPLSAADGSSTAKSQHFDDSRDATASITWPKHRHQHSSMALSSLLHRDSSYSWAPTASSPTARSPTARSVADDDDQPF